MSQLEIFRGTNTKIMPDFIRLPNVDGTVKLIVVLENAYLRGVKRGLFDDSSHKYPTIQFLADCLDLAYRTVFTKQKTEEYKIYSPAHNNGKNITIKKGNPWIDVPISFLASNRLTVYEKLVYLDMLCYEYEGMDDMSMGELADDLIITRVYVNKMINNLLSYGLLTKKRSTIPNAGKFRNVYTLTGADVEAVMQKQVDIEMLKVNFGF